MKKLSDKEVIEEAIKIAVKNGYTPYWTPYWQHSEMVDNKEGYLETIVSSILKEHSITEIIFDHEFAKALFGSERIYTRMDFGGVHEVKDLDKSTYVVWEAYRYHLMKLALSEDRIDYLRKFMEKIK
jgi:hypothetical protein